MIHLIVGNTGSGKTTYATELQIKTKGIIFSIDTWNKLLFLADKKPTDGLEWFLDRIDRAEKMIITLVQQLENNKTDSVLDLGLSRFKHREKFRSFAASHGFEIKLHYLNISKELRLQRVMKRNHDKGATYEFEVGIEDFDFMETWFEEPTKKEMKGGTLISE